MANEMVGNVGSASASATLVTLSPAVRTLEIAVNGGGAGDRTVVVINGESVSQAIMANGVAHVVERGDQGISSVRMYAHNSQTDQVYAMFANRMAFRN